MFFLSSILDAPVIDNALERVGIVQDVVASGVVPNLYPPVRALLVHTSAEARDLLIPWSVVESFGAQAVRLTVVRQKIITLVADTQDTLLRKNVLDQQIIDTSGARVVRVNDLQLGLVEGKVCVIAIDVSFKALLRRLKIEELDFWHWFPVKLIDWRQAQLASGSIQLASLTQDLVRLHPADVANIIEELNVQQGTELIKSFDLATASKVFQEMDPDTRKILVATLGPEKVAQITDRMPIDEIVDLLKNLPIPVQQTLLTRIQTQKAQSVGKLMRYANNTAGGLLTTDFLKADPRWSVERTIDEIRNRSPQFRTLNYVYVVDGDDIFLGVVSLRRLLLADSLASMTTVMRDRKELKTLRPHWRLNRVAAVMTKYNLSSVSVVEKGKMIGVVTIDDVMRALMPNA